MQYKNELLIASIFFITFTIIVIIVNIKREKPKLGDPSGLVQTPGFDGSFLAGELSKAFEAGWFGDTERKANVLRQIDNLPLGDLVAVYNAFAINESEKYDGKTMKQVISEEWITWVFEKNRQKSIVEKLNSLRLP